MRHAEPFPGQAGAAHDWTREGGYVARENQPPMQHPEGKKPEAFGDQYPKEVRGKNGMVRVESAEEEKKVLAEAKESEAVK